MCSSACINLWEKEYTYSWEKTLLCEKVYLFMRDIIMWNDVPILERNDVLIRERELYYVKGCTYPWEKVLLQV